MGNKPRLVKHMKELRGTYVGFPPVRLAVRCASVNLANRRCGELDGEMEPWRHYRALRATDMQPPVEMRRRRAVIERKRVSSRGKMGERQQEKEIFDRTT
jgi:hypothetical protein